MLWCTTWGRSVREAHLKHPQRVSSIMAITTPARVRNRIQAAEAEISNDVLDEFIAEPRRRAALRRIVCRQNVRRSRSTTCTRAFDLHRPLRSQGIGLLVRAFRWHLVHDRLALRIASNVYGEPRCIKPNDEARKAIVQAKNSSLLSIRVLSFASIASITCTSSCLANTCFR